MQILHSIHPRTVESVLRQGREIISEQARQGLTLGNTQCYNILWRSDLVLQLMHNLTVLQLET